MGQNGTLYSNKIMLYVSMVEKRKFDFATALSYDTEDDDYCIIDTMQSIAIDSYNYVCLLSRERG
eukprot:scaffold1955_cov60-Attheya_sp.AAC.2